MAILTLTSDSNKNICSKYVVNRSTLTRTAGAKRKCRRWREAALFPAGDKWYNIAFILGVSALDSGGFLSVVFTVVLLLFINRSAFLLTSDEQLHAVTSHQLFIYNIYDLINDKTTKRRLPRQFVKISQVTSFSTSSV